MLKKELPIALAGTCQLTTSILCVCNFLAIYSMSTELFSHIPGMVLQKLPTLDPLLGAAEANSSGKLGERGLGFGCS